MYTFVCSGRPSHFSHSASKEQHDPACPTCGEPTHLAEAIEKMAKEGASVLDICTLTGVSAPAVRELLPEEDEDTATEITEEQNIWFPGIYKGREGDYAKIASSLSAPEVIELVQTRAKEDGEWSIENNRVGGRPEFMRKMMAWVSDPRNIKQCVNMNPDETTVDWICRELANAAKAVGGSRG